MHNIYFYKTEIGIIGIRENGKSITNIFFSNSSNKEDNINETELIKIAFNQIQEYIDGNREYFDLPLELYGTEFQKKYGMN